MYKLDYSTQFKKDIKRIKKQSVKNFSLLFNMVQFIEINGLAKVPKKHKPHPLIGNFKEYTDIHVLPDLLLICKEDTPEEIIYLARAGSHSEIFG